MKYSQQIATLIAGSRKRRRTEMLHISNDWSATNCCLPALTSNEGEGKMFSEILQQLVNSWWKSKYIEFWGNLYEYFSKSDLENMCNHHTTNFAQLLCNLEDRNETTGWDCDLNWVLPCLRAIWESLQLFSSKHSELLFKHAEFCTNFSDLLTKRCRQPAKHFFVKNAVFFMKTVKQPLLCLQIPPSVSTS